MESATVLHPDGCYCMKSPCRCKQQRWRRHRRHRKASRERIQQRKTKIKKDDIKRSFQTEWLTKYAWIKYEDGEMYCSVCKAFKKKNTLTSGSTNFCTSTLVRHIESRDHRESVIARQSGQRMEMMIKKSFSKDKSLIAALRTVYFMAKQDIASIKYPDFIDFLVMQGCSSLNAITTGGAASASYRSHGIVSEMHESLFNVTQYCEIFFAHNILLILTLQFHGD